MSDSERFLRARLVDRLDALGNAFVSTLESRKLDCWNSIWAARPEVNLVSFREHLVTKKLHRVEMSGSRVDAVEVKAGFPVYVTREGRWVMVGHEQVQGSYITYVWGEFADQFSGARELSAWIEDIVTPYDRGVWRLRMTPDGSLGSAPPGDYPIEETLTETLERLIAAAARD